ncbi:hypothetical protein HAX54_002754, partial [Datura stramonium]|nr:hypothetical protein [Datura stramonium]
MKFECYLLVHSTIMDLPCILIDLLNGSVKSHITDLVLDPQTFTRYIFKIKQKKRSHVSVVSMEIPYADTPHRKKRKSIRTSSFGTIVMTGVSPSPPHPDLILDVVIIEEYEDTYEETLFLKKPRSSLAKDSASSSLKSPIMTQSNETDLPTLLWPVGIAKYLLSLISDLEKDKMKDLSEYCLFNKGMHATARAEILIDEGLQLSLRNNKDLKAQLNLQECDILALKVEISRRMEETVFTIQIANLKVDLKKSKSEHALAFQELDLAGRERESYSLQAEQLLSEMNTLKEFHLTQE